jgi:hypothetical protein
MQDILLTVCHHSLVSPRKSKESRGM